MNSSRNRSFAVLAILSALLVAIALVQLTASDREPDVATREQHEVHHSNAPVEQTQLRATPATTDEPATPDEYAEHQWADGIKSLIFDHLAQQTDYVFTSITSVECSAHECEIVFTGIDASPKFVDDFSGINSGMFSPPISAATSTLFTREIVTGAREYVLRISNIPWEGRDEEPQEEN